MPRYFGTDKMVFTDAEGNEYDLYEPQEIERNRERLVYKGQIDLKEEDELDEIAQRKNVYGSNQESAWYNIFDFNHVEICENDYSISGLKILNIPSV